MEEFEKDPNLEITTNDSNADSVKEYSEDEDILQRNNSLEAAGEFFMRKDIRMAFDQISNEPDSEKRAEMIKELCKDTNSVLSGTQNAEFGVNVKVQLAGVEHEIGTEWNPPRPMDEIFNEYLKEVGNLLNKGNKKEAASVLFQSITLGHPFRDGNGRTARLLFLHAINPNITATKDILSKYVVNEDIRVESRKICDDVITEAVDTIRRKTDNQDLPFIFIDGMARSGAGADLLRLAYKQLNPINASFVVHMDKLSDEKQEELRKTEDHLKRDILHEILNSPKARARTFEGLWASQTN